MFTVVTEADRKAAAEFVASPEAKGPQDHHVWGVSYKHTFDPMGHICPMHYPLHHDRSRSDEP